MGVSFYIDLVSVKSAEQFPYLKALLEKNADSKRDVFGTECYVIETVERELDWDWSVNIDGDKEKEQFRKEIEEEWGKQDEESIDDYAYVRFMIDYGKVETEGFSVDC